VWVRAVAVLFAAGLFAVGVRPAVGQSIDWGGFVKAEYLYDTRQVNQTREGEFLLFPVPDPNPDDDGDPSDTDNLGAFAFFSRLGLTVSDFDQAVLGGEATGYIEADFFGSDNAGVSNFRLRRGFVRLAWDNREVLFGQEWSPLFTLAAFPRTVATATGAPFQPFSRQPQARLTLLPGNLRLIGAVGWQRDAFQEIGGAKQQQQAGLPGLHGHVQLAVGRSTLGAGGYYKWIRPTLTSERFGAGAVQGYATLVGLGRTEVRAKATYGGDLADHLMSGGYVTLSTGAFEPLNVFSAWIDLQATGRISPGIFAGYLANLGTSETGVVVVAEAARASSLDRQWRAAPRLALNAGPVRFAFELEVTSALYASRFDDSYAPAATDADESVTNVRGNLAVFLFF
jgi:hypothetical protein